MKHECNSYCKDGVHAILWYWLTPPTIAQLTESLAAHHMAYVRHQRATEAMPFGEVSDKGRYDRGYLVFARTK